jgi:hypothetical protein
MPDPVPLLPKLLILAAGVLTLSPRLVDAVEGALKVLADSLERRGEAAGMILSGTVRADGTVMVLWTSGVASCRPREAMAQPARAPAAPVAVLTSPACPVPFASDVVVTGP